MNLDHPVAKGNTAELYLVDNKIIKLFFEWLPEDEAKYEAYKQELAFTAGIRVPQIFDITSINGRPAILMEYIEGPTLGEMLEKEPERAEYFITLSVNSQQEIHAKAMAAFEPMTNKLERQIGNADLLDKETQMALQQRLHQMPEMNRLCHGDFHLNNLIYGGSDQITVIDWVDATIGNPCADVCRTYLLYAQFSLELAEKYLNIYCDKSGCSNSDIMVWAPIIAGARLHEKAGYENPDQLIQIIQKAISD